VVVAAETLVVIDSGEERVKQPGHGGLLLGLVVIAHLLGAGVGVKVRVGMVAFSSGSS
jgi:hypothetical protein